MAGSAAPLPEGAPSVLDAYVTGAPSPEQAVSIFAGQWASRFPPPLQDVPAGEALLFDDVRLQWGLDALGGVAGASVLELGPLEGGHTYLLDRLGAAEVTAVEANTRAYVKCLIAKELLGMPSARFLCGDCMAYLEQEKGLRFDLAVASGVLYHMRRPIRLLELLCQVSDQLFVWTHYFDAEVVEARPELAVKFPASRRHSEGGYEHTLHRFEYQAALDNPGFCGGSAPYSEWVSESDLTGALRHFGFEVVGVEHRQPDHINGPCLALVSRRVR